LSLPPPPYLRARRPGALPPRTPPLGPPPGAPRAPPRPRPTPGPSGGRRRTRRKARHPRWSAGAGTERTAGYAAWSWEC
ncbi:hypothetical protein, partial [Nocardia abscessus]|uniref:hypothetical protein n=1 Tax=Nocardia abscessus TaxID=120957 RepID=UPI002453A702